MFCPRCAAHNIEDAKYCRVCGADISLLPQVLSGELTANLEAADEAGIEASEKRGKRQDKAKDKDKKTPTLEEAFENIGVGIAFLAISIIIALFVPSGRFWWFWLLIPALACAGEGIGQFMRIQREKALGSAGVPNLPAPRQNQAKNLPPRNTAEMLMPPPSITEGTTRHLNQEPLKKSFDDRAERPHESMFDSNAK